MKTDRRTLLKTGAVVGAAAGIPLATRDKAKAGEPLVVFDSSIAESADFASGTEASGKIDIARAEEDFWARLRSDLPGGIRLEGLTGWSGWVMIRGELEQRGWRVAAERRSPAPLSGRTHLIRWSLAARRA